MGKISTDFLISESTLITGFGTAVNLAGNFYRFNTAATSVEADMRALRSDWIIIGQDLSDVMESVSESELDGHKCLTKK